MTSIKLNFHQTPEDLYIIRKLSLISGSKQKSDVVRAAIHIARIAITYAREGRLVLRNTDLHQQMDVYVGSGIVTPSDEVQETRNAMLQVRCDPQTRENLNLLVQCGFGANMTAVVRRALPLNLQLLEYSTNGWQFGYVFGENVFSRIVIPELTSSVTLDSAGETLNPLSLGQSSRGIPTPAYDDFFLPLDTLQKHRHLPNKGCIKRCRDLYLELVSLIAARHSVDQDASSLDVLVGEIERQFHEMLHGLLDLGQPCNPAELLLIIHDMEEALGSFNAYLEKASVRTTSSNAYLHSLWVRYSSERLGPQSVRDRNVLQFRPWDRARTGTD